MAINDLKPPKILFFHHGPMPSAAQYAEALDYGSNVQYRNADFVYEGDRPEECQGVAGDIPKSYRKIPRAAKALAAYRTRMKASLAGEEPAPVVEEEEEEPGDDGDSKTPPNWQG